MSVAVSAIDRSIDRCTVVYMELCWCRSLPILVLYCIVSYRSCYIVLYCTVLYCTVLYCTVLCCIVLYCIVLYGIVLYCIELYCIVNVHSKERERAPKIGSFKNKDIPAKIYLFTGSWLLLIQNHF